MEAPAHGGHVGARPVEDPEHLAAAVQGQLGVSRQEGAGEPVGIVGALGQRGQDPPEGAAGPHSPRGNGWWR